MDRRSTELSLAWIKDQRNCVWHGQTTIGTVFSMDSQSTELCLAWTDNQPNSVWHEYVQRNNVALMDDMYNFLLLDNVYKLQIHKPYLHDIKFTNKAMFLCIFFYTTVNTILPLTTMSL